MFNTELTSKYLARFTTGFPPAKLVAAATPDNGIETPGSDEQLDLVINYRNQRNGLNILKFVPASGAATRMFQPLFQALAEIDGHRPMNVAARKFLDNISVFPFAEMLDEVMQSEYGCQLQAALEGEKYADILTAVLDKSGLNFAETPKAFIPFHRGADGHPETAMKAHFEEARRYASADGFARLHFTVAADYLEMAREHAAACAFGYDDTVFEVSFSVQDPATDTPAVYEDNSAVLLDNGSVLMRPSGHGALIYNLSNIEADIIFIKNIDNVAPASGVERQTHFKEMLAGRLLQLRDEVHNALRALETGDDSKARRLAHKFYKDLDAEVSAASLLKLLNVPIRVCGMVPNAGAPGGGPFWVRQNNGLATLQIVESAQTDTRNDAQMQIVQGATHFNPVDIVCCIRDFKGKPFSLPDFIDNEAGFIVQKTYKGRKIKAIELPGLWNGAMARWISIFVEVPAFCFQPVKEINDLLGPLHRG
jgi:hypothetical protein